MLNRWTRLRSLSPLRLLGLLFVLLLLAACRREPEPVEGAPQEPVAAVNALAVALHEGDLKRYAQLSLPPALHAQRRRCGTARWPPAPASTPSARAGSTS